MREKTCTSCSTNYPATDEYFYREPANRGGNFRLPCKQCRRKQRKENHNPAKTPRVTPPKNHPDRPSAQYLRARQETIDQLIADEVGAGELTHEEAVRRIKQRINNSVANQLLVKELKHAKPSARAHAAQAVYVLVCNCCGGEATMRMEVKQTNYTDLYPICGECFYKLKQKYSEIITGCRQLV